MESDGSHNNVGCSNSFGFFANEWVLRVRRTWGTLPKSAQSQPGAQTALKSRAPGPRGVRTTLAGRRLALREVSRFSDLPTRA